VLSALAFREIRGQYRSTILGQLWSLANPLVQVVVYTFVFSFVFQVESEPGNPSGVHVYAIFLLCGLVPWALFQSATTAGMMSLLTNSNLINKVYFPRLVIPLSAIAATGYNSLFEFLVLVVALAVAGSFVLPWLPMALALVFLLVVFATGLALMLSISNLYFRDTQYLTGIVFQVWMWLSPIIYPISLISERSDEIGPLAGTSVTVLDVYSVNPMVHFISAFRDVMYDNRMPSAMTLLLCLAWSLVSLGLGWLVFRRNENRLAELL
jgi:ABC-2 type transport system permease protein